MFWNEAHHRLKMAWRMLIYLVALFALALLFSVATTIPVIVVWLVSFGQEVTFTRLSDVATLSGDPLILLASALAMLGAILLATWLVGRFIDRRHITDFGLRLNGDWFIDLGFGLALGAVLMALVFGLELIAGWVDVRAFAVGREYPFILAFVGQLIAFLCVGIYEEVAFRGYIFKNMAEGFLGVGRVPAIWLAYGLSSLVFGVFHAGNPNATVLSTFNIFLAGFMLGVGTLITGKIAIPIGLHITWNFFQGAVFGFPVSGISPSGAVIAIEQGGPRLITGGPFGPEAGLIGIAAMVLGILLTVGYVYVRYGSVGLHQGLTVPDLRPRQKTNVE